MNRLPRDPIERRRAGYRTALELARELDLPHRMVLTWIANEEIPVVERRDGYYLEEAVFQSVIRARAAPYQD